jgi:hypothetical protein
MPVKHLTRDDRTRIKEMLAYGAKRRAIAKVVGCSASTVSQVSLGRREDVAFKRRTLEEILGPRRSGGPDPTTDEIATACAAIRRTRNQENLAMVRAAERMGRGWTASEGGAP